MAAFPAAAVAALPAGCACRAATPASAAGPSLRSAFLHPTPCRVAPAGGRRGMSASRIGAPVATRRSVVRAERGGSDSSFTAGFVLGGVVFGALGFLFAPQLSKALLGDSDRIRLPRFLDEEEQANADLDVTRASLNEKIAQLNSALDDVSSQLKLEKAIASKNSAAAAAQAD